jgi:hypothetical protein
MKPTLPLWLKLGVAWPALCALLSAHVCAQETSAPFWNVAIVTPTPGSPIELLAAKEIRRYVYATTGRLLAIQPETALLATQQNFIAIGRCDREMTRQFLTVTGGPSGRMDPQDYCLKTIQEPHRRVLVLAGGDDTGTLYAAYRYAEHLGVRFYLHGDVIPDPASRKAMLPPAGLLPDLNESSHPLFPLRGIQPFHDFPEGPDWWDREDYLAITAQLPKLRMNFLGLHTYPEGAPNAEPTVWIGRPEEIREAHQVAFAYPSSYQNTRRGNWGYAAKPTSRFPFGANQLFEREDYGNDVMSDLAPEPAQATAAGELFRRTGTLLGEVFAQARALGVKTCLGTETPLIIPKALREYLRTQNQNPTNAVTVRRLYEGIFQRLNQTSTPDYYWFWTPETWTWEGVKEGQVQATLDDLRLAQEAAQSVPAKFQLATCGWVLGPPEDRSLFDKALPKSWPVSCINRELGKTPVEPGFASVTGRPKWAIPWLEDDPAITVPQLWAGRMRQDAADALRYGCDGIMGIHWRTRALGPAVSALAQAAWEQDSWKCDTADISGWIGGKNADFPTNTILCDDHAPIYQTVRYGMSHGQISLPNGEYQVRLRFCEPHFDAIGKRVFSVKLQNRLVVDHLDIFAQAGKNHALDRTFDGILVDHGRLDLEFINHTEQACVAGIELSSERYLRKINCGGKACLDFEADFAPIPRHQPADDLYLDWARCEFGPEAAEAIAAIFAALDGQLPCPADWVDGPGNLKCEPRSWLELAPEYAFVDRLRRLQSRVKGRLNQERFAYWLNSFEYLRAMARLSCTWGELSPVMEKIEAEKDPRWKTKLATAFALPLRQTFVRQLSEVYTPLLALVSNPGEMGVIANWGQHIPVKTLEQTDARLAQCLGTAFTKDEGISMDYQGPNRIIVPTIRTSLKANEPLTLKAILLSQSASTEATLFWHPLGVKGFQKAPFQHVARSVYRVALPARAIAGRDIEYYIQAKFAKNQTLKFPVTAPLQAQTVVIQP